MPRATPRSSQRRKPLSLGQKPDWMQVSLWRQSAAREPCSIVAELVRHRKETQMADSTAPKHDPEESLHDTNSLKVVHSSDISVAGAQVGRTRWVIMALILFPLTFVMSLDRTNIVVSAPIIQQQFHFSLFEMSLILTSFAWTYSFLQ